jgi:hypothetical protein
MEANVRNSSVSKTAGYGLEAGVLCPVARIVILSSTSRTVSETSQSPIQQVQGVLSLKLDPLFISRSKPQGFVRSPPSFVVRCWSQDQFLYMSSDRLVLPSCRQVVGATQWSRRAVLKARQSAMKYLTEWVCPIHSTKFTVGLMVTVLIILTASWFDSGNLHHKQATRRRERINRPTHGTALCGG